MTTQFGFALPTLIASVSIDFDRTFILQMAVFALLIVVLRPLLFDPVLSIFEERERRTDGAKAEARDDARGGGRAAARVRARARTRRRGGRCGARSASYRNRPTTRLKS